MAIVECTPKGAVTLVTMNRPDKHNAFNPELIDELQRIFIHLGQDPTVRVIVLKGNGKSFSAGADLDWMQSQGQADFEENRRSSTRMGELFRTIDQCPKPVVAVVHGAALGGGAGLVASVDIALAGPEAVFGFTEVRLGLVAAVISPFVVRRLGPSVAREKLLTGERFDAQEALRIGLVHQVSSDLEGLLESTTKSLLKGSPQAQASSKRLLSQIWDLNEDDQLPVTARCIAEARASQDGLEGLAAFLDKRKPSWDQ